MIAAFSVLAGPQMSESEPWSGPTHDVATLSVLESTSIEYRLRVPMANTSGSALPDCTSGLLGANRLPPLGAVESGTVYVAPRPGVSPGLATGWMRSSLP